MVKGREGKTLPMVVGLSKKNDNLDNIFDQLDNLTNSKKQYLELQDVPDIKFNSNIAVYFNKLCNFDIHMKRQELSQTEMQVGPLSVTNLAKLTLNEQTSTIMKHKHICSFAQIKQMITKKAADEEIITSLNLCAKIVCGNFISESSTISNNIYEALCRDLLIVILLNKTVNNATKGLTREEFIKATQLPVQKAKDILNQISEYRRNEPSGWWFKISPNKEFVDAHKSLCDEADKFWNNRKQEVVLKLKVLRDAANKQQTQTNRK